MSASGQSWPHSCLELGAILDNFWPGHLGMVVLRDFLGQVVVCGLVVSGKKYLNQKLNHNDNL